MMINTNWCGAVHFVKGDFATFCLFAYDVLPLCAFFVSGPVPRILLNRTQRHGFMVLQEGFQAP